MRSGVSKSCLVHKCIDKIIDRPKQNDESLNRFLRKSSWMYSARNSSDGCWYRCLKNCLYISTHPSRNSRQNTVLDNFAYTEWRRWSYSEDIYYKFDNIFFIVIHALSIIWGKAKSIEDFWIKLFSDIRDLRTNSKTFCHQIYIG